MWACIKGSRPATVKKATATLSQQPFTISPQPLGHCNPCLGCSSARQETRYGRNVPACHHHWFVAIFCCPIVVAASELTSLDLQHTLTLPPPHWLNTPPSLSDVPHPNPLPADDAVPPPHPQDVVSSTPSPSPQTYAVLTAAAHTPMAPPSST